MDWNACRAMTLSGMTFERFLVPALIASAVWLILAGIASQFARQRPQPAAGDSRWLGRLIYVAFLLVIAILSGTAFGSILRIGRMEHYGLLIHLVAAGAFTVLLLLVALVILPISSSTRHTWWLQRWSAWALILSGMLTAASMLLGMLPLLDTDGLLAATEVHRYAGLATLISAVTHGLTVMSNRPSRTGGP